MVVPRGKRHAHLIHVMHFLIACMPFRLRFIAHRLCFHRKADAARGPERPTKAPMHMSPPDAILLFPSVEPNVQHVIMTLDLRCTGICRWGSAGGLRPPFCHQKPPSRTPRNLRVAMRMVAQRPAKLRWRIGPSVLCFAIMPSAPLMAALKACAPAALYWGTHEINKDVTFS